MKKIKLLFIMPSMGGGGAERVLINLLNQIDFNEYDVDLILLMNKGKLWSNIPKQVTKRNLGFSPLYLKSLSYIYRIFNLNLFWLLNNKIGGNYDVGISFMDSIFTELLFLKDLNLKKKVTVVHSSYKSYINRSKFIKGRYKSVMFERYKKLDNIICVSNESKKEFIELFGSENNVEVIYNPLNKIDVIKQSNGERPVEMKSNIFQFVAVGSLIPVKDFELLIRAANLLKKSGINFQLHILGDGYLKPKLVELIKLFDLDEIVILHGFKENPYIWLKHTDLFIMSSKVEGLPTVLCESIIMEKPVLVPNVPGCREVVGYGEFGIMCERNEVEFFKAMKKCITDPSLIEELKIKAKERSKIFEDKVAIEKYNNIFKN